MYMLIYCVDHDIDKSVYATHEAAYEAMLSRIANLTGERPEPDADGYTTIAGGVGEVFYNRAYLIAPAYGDGNNYDWVILEV